MLQIKWHKLLWTMVINHNHSHLYGWEEIHTIHMYLAMNAWPMLIDHQGNYFQAMHKCSILYLILLIHVIFHSCFSHLPILSRLIHKQWMILLLLSMTRGYCSFTQKFWKHMETKHIGKTPAWTIVLAHCLEWLSNMRKCNCLFPCNIPKLGKHQIMHI